MNFKSYLQEVRYFKKVKSGFPYQIEAGVEVFVNPSSNEITEKEYNFIIDLEDKKLYIWPKKSGVLHYDVGKETIKDWDEDNLKRFVLDDAETSNNKLLFYPSKYLTRLLAKQEWLKKYFIFKFDEEYLGLAKAYLWSNKKWPVFVNPTSKEIRECGDTIRFIINWDKKKLYCWNGERLVHREAAAFLYREDEIDHKDLGEPDFWNNYYAGVTKLHGSKLSSRVFHSDYLYGDESLIEYIGWFDDDEKWLLKWFDGPIIDNIEKDFELNEEYLGQMKGSFWSDNTSSIFKNPSKKEIKECGSEIRFIADFKNKNLYIWNGNVLIHSEVARFLRNEGEIPSAEMGEMSFWKWCYAGIARQSMGKLKFYRHSDWLENKESYDDIDLDYAEWTDEDDSWTKQWFTEPLLQSIHDYGY